MVQKKRKELKQQHMNGTGNNLLKGCTITGVRNYNQKSSGRPGMVRSGKWRLPEELVFTKSSFQRHLPQDYREESSRT
ncbi:hypothetical protein TNCV_4717261 [Trichonephila clavipes]|nr:hypothetical protein TNCV_4717261 [Trichonephila clavipes]